MKKVFSVLMVCAFAISATAQWLIYDYKVSIKRIDAQYSKLTYKIDEFDAKIPKGAGCPNYMTGYFDSFTTANDTLTGYILMPACSSCGGDWMSFGSAQFQPALDGYTFVAATTAAEFQATQVTWDYYDSFFVGKYTDADEKVYETSFAYIQRKGDKLYTNPLKEAYFGKKSKTINNKLTWKIGVNVDAARFGKGAGARLAGVYFTNADGVITKHCTCPAWVTDASIAAIIAKYYGTPTHTKPVKEAWMVLTYDVFAFLGTTNNTAVVNGNNSTVIYPPVKGLGVDDCTPAALRYGFLGYQSARGSISHAGFGKVTTTGTAGSTSVGFCGSVSVDPTTCTAVNTISGTIAGLFEATDFCSETPEWDICYFLKAEGQNSSNKHYAPVCGNWSVKLNQSESKKYGASFKSAEDRVLSKLKCSPTSSWRTELSKNFIYDGSLDTY